MTPEVAPAIHVLSPRPAESRPRQQSRVRLRGAIRGTYDQDVSAAASKDPRILMFAQFVRRALDEAGQRKMSIEDVEEAIRRADPTAKLGRSTIYRWRRAEVADPSRTQVQQFCDGLGIDRKVAAQILGWDGSPPSDAPDPGIDPDLRAVMRRLNDPAVAPEEKTVIRSTLRYLAKGG